MSNHDRPHWSMALYADNPIVMVGDTVRLRGEAKWMDGQGGEVFVPAETLGTIFALGDNSGGVGICFQGFSHPRYSLFPMSLHKPGQSRYSDNFTLISRIAYDPRNQVPDPGLQEPPETWRPVLPRGLGHGAAGAPKESPALGSKGLRKPKAQSRSAGGPAGGPRTPGPTPAAGISASPHPSNVHS